MPKTLRYITTRNIRLAVKIFIVVWIAIGIDTFLADPILKPNERLMAFLLLHVFMFIILTSVVIELFDYTAKAFDRQSLYTIKLNDRIKVLEATRTNFIESKHLIIEHVQDEDIHNFSDQDPDDSPNRLQWEDLD